MSRRCNLNLNALIHAMMYPGNEDDQYLSSTRSRFSGNFTLSRKSAVAIFVFGNDTNLSTNLETNPGIGTASLEI